MTFFSHIEMPCNKFSPNLMWKYQIIPFIFLGTTRSRVSSKNRSVPPNSILRSSSSLWPPTPAHASVSLLLSSSSSAVCFVLISSLSSFLRPLMLLASFLSSAVRRTLPLQLLLPPLTTAASSFLFSSRYLDSCTDMLPNYGINPWNVDC